MSYKLQKISKKEAPFFICYTIYLVISLLYTSMFSVYILSIYKYILWGVVVLLFANEMTQGKYSLKAMIIAVIIAGIALIISWSVDGSVFILCLLTFVWCSRDVSFDRIAKFTIIVVSILIGIIVFSGLIGIIENYQLTLEGRTRYFLGFRYALYLPTYLFNLSSLYIYVHKKRLKIVSLVVIFFINSIVFTLTNSRLSYIMTILLLLVAVVIKCFPFFLANRKLFFRLLTGSFIFWFVLSLFMTITYSSANPTMREINEFLGRRLSLGQRGILFYGIHLFGQSIEWVGNGLSSSVERYIGMYNYVDCLYIKMLIQYGVVFTILYLTLHTFTAFRCYKERKYCLLIMLSFISMRVVIEDLSLLLHYNTFWFAIGMILRNTVKVNARDAECMVPDFIEGKKLRKRKNRLKMRNRRSLL